jgi:hypothetical protein
MAVLVLDSREAKRCADYITVRCPASLRQGAQQASDARGVPISEYVREALQRQLREDGIALDEPVA